MKVKFVIGSNGFVTTTGIAESSVRNSTLENCIAARVKSWEFPKPKGGGVAMKKFIELFQALDATTSTNAKVEALELTATLS